MDLAEVELIESELQIELPKHYKQFLLNYPLDKLFWGSISKSELLNFAKSDSEEFSGIISINKYTQCYLSEGEQLVKNKICIGGIDGDYYFIDLINKDNTCVYWIQHDSSYYDFYDELTKEWDWEKLVIANSLDDFSNYLIANYNS